MSKLNVVVLYDRWEEPEAADASSADKAPLTRTLDKKEVEDEVADTLGKLGHEADAACARRLDQEPARARADGLRPGVQSAESFAGNDTADYCIAAYLELIDKRIHRRPARTGCCTARTRRSPRRSSSSTASTRRCSRARSAAGSIFRTISSFRSSSSRRARTARSASSSTPSCRSIRELMERIDWLHANFDSPVLIEEYVDGREMYVGVIGNDNPTALPVVELDLSKLPEGTPRIAGAEVKWGKGTRAYRDTKSAVAEDLPEETAALLQQTAVAVFQALELRDYARIDMRLRPDGRVAVIEANPNPWLASKAEFAMAARKSGRNYTQLIEEIVDLAMARYGGRS